MEFQKMSPLQFEALKNRARESDSTVTCFLMELGFAEDVAERIIGKMEKDVSYKPPRELSTDECSQLLGHIRETVRAGEHLVRPKQSQLPRKNNDLE